MSEIATPVAAAEPREARSSGRFWLVLRRELVDLWVGGRMLFLVLLFTVLMSLTAISRELESQLSLIPPAEMVFLTLLSAISFGMLLSIVVGADSISGDRERGTLEPMLLSPTGRRRIVLAKFAAALSPWPVALVLSLPYVIVLGKGDEILIPGLAWTAALGTLLAMAFSSFAILVSLWSRSNRTSLFVCLLVYLLFLIPTQFPGQAQKGGLGYALQQVDPMQATSEFLEKFIVNNRPPSERYTYLISTIGSAAFFVVVLFGYAAPRLALEGGSPRLGRGAKRAAKAGAATAVLAALTLAGPAAGVVSAGTVAVAATVEASAITIDIDKDAEVIKTGDEIEFTTTVTNTGSTASPELVVAMNIINLGKSDPVDPEDWSPERTQHVDALDPGASAEQTWSVEGILDGNYMVYMTAIVKPGAPAETTLPVTSPGIHLTVQPYQSTNPGGVLPVAIGMPLGLLVVAFLLRRYWRRERRPATGQAVA
jgi:ABC-2 type transport system permease protein